MDDLTKRIGIEITDLSSLEKFVELLERAAKAAPEVAAGLLGLTATINTASGTQAGGASPGTRAAAQTADVVVDNEKVSAGKIGTGRGRPRNQNGENVAIGGGSGSPPSNLDESYAERDAQLKLGKNRKYLDEVSSVTRERREREQTYNQLFREVDTRDKNRLAQDTEERTRYLQQRDRDYKGLFDQAKDRETGRMLNQTEERRRYLEQRQSDYRDLFDQAENREVGHVFRETEERKRYLSDRDAAHKENVSRQVEHDNTLQASMKRVDADNRDVERRASEIMQDSKLADRAVDEDRKSTMLAYAAQYQQGGEFYVEPPKRTGMGGSAAQKIGALYRGVAYTGIGYQGMQLASEYARATGAGDQFYLPEHAGQIGSVGLGLAGLVAGGLIGAATHNPALAGSFAMTGGILGALIGDPIAQNYGGKREFRERSQALSAATGYGTERISDLAVGIGRERNPFNNNQPFNKKLGQEEFASELPLAMVGANDDFLRSTGMTMLRDFGVGGPKATQNLAPFALDPFLRGTMMAQLQANNAERIRDANQNDFRPQGSRQDYGRPNRVLDESFATEGVLTQGFASTWTALGDLLKKDPQRMEEMRSRALRFNDQLQTTSLAGEQAGSSTAIAQAQAAQVRATGIAPDSGAVGQAFAEQVRAIDANITAIKAMEDVYRSARGPHAAAELRATQALEAQAQAARQGLLQERVGEVQAARTARVATARGIAGAEFTAGSFGLAPGSINPARGEVERTTRAALADADYRARYAPTFEGRLSAMQEARGLRTMTQNILPRERTTEQFGVPAQEAQRFTARQVALLAQTQSFGAGPDTLEGMYDTTIASSERTVRRNQELLNRRQADFSRRAATIDDVDQARDQLQQSQMQTRQLRRSAAYERPAFDLTLAGYDVAEVAGAQRLTALRGEGPGADLIAALKTAGQQTSQMSRYDEMIAAARGQGDDRSVAEYGNARALLGQQREAGVLGAFGSYTPSARDQVRLGGLGLAISLQEQDQSFGGQVSPSTRRQYMSALLSQASGIETQIARSPNPDATRAALFPQYAGYLEAAEQQRQKLQYGEVGNLLSRTIGATGDMTYWGPSLREYQQINPGGLLPLGGSGADVGQSPFAFQAQAMGAPLHTVADLLGGTSKGENTEVVQLLQRIATSLEMRSGYSEVRGARGPGSMTNPPSINSQTPDGQAIDRAAALQGVRR